MKTELNIAELYPKILEWLGKNCIIHNTALFGEDKLIFFSEGEEIDFLHDRNQQKWIEDKLIELGYYVYYYKEDIGWEIFIYNVNSNYKKDVKIKITNKSKDIAFLEAIEQLINQENENKK